MNFGFFRFTITGLGFLGILLMFTLSGIIGAFCWPYVFNTWLGFFGKAAVVLWWQGFLLGYIPWIGQWSLPAAVITWILMMFIG